MNNCIDTSQEEDVYDILDAGPLHRFTVIGNSPMIAHNCQSTGHDAHMLFQVLIAEHLSRDGFDWHPWHMDMHDCSMFAVRADQAEAACNLLTYVIYPELNKMLGGEIALKGDPNVCITWADDKDEERRWEEDINVKERINKLRKAISGTCR